MGHLPACAESLTYKDWAEKFGPAPTRATKESEESSRVSKRYVVEWHGHEQDVRQTVGHERPTHTSLRALRAIPRTT